MNKNFKNEFVSVRFNEGHLYNRDDIVFRNLTDRYNDPTGYTKKIRGIKKAWEFITQIFNDERFKDDLDFNDIRKILDEKFNLDVHTYCAVD